MKISQTQKNLLGALSKVLSDTTFELPEQVDWAELYEESKMQAVLPLVFTAIGQYCTDPEIKRQWKLITMQNMQKNRTVQLQHGQLHQLMTDNNIPYAIIKGCASALDYPDPLLRAMGDVDFLVAEDHWDRAKELLIQEGFLAKGDTHDFHLAFHKKHFNMEMHHEPFGLKGENAAALLELVPELVEKSVPVTCNGISFRMPDAFGHGIVLLLHAYRHLIDSGVGVRHLCDWAMFISHFSGEEFANIFQERFEVLGIWKLTQIFSATAHVYLSVPYQQWMGEIDKEACELLMLDILDGGNFGRGDSERRTQNRSLYTEDNELAEGSRRMQLLKSLNQTAMIRYPRMMKHKILRPFGCVILSVRYFCRVLTGKRQRVPKDTMQMVSIRRKLYQQLHVFEVK